MGTKDFTNETEARIFRDAKRDEGSASSLFTYGKDRYRVKVMDTTDDKNPGWTQRYLSDQAWKLSHDIEDLTEINRIIDSGELIDCEYDSVVFVAKYLEKERWFTSPKAVIDFFDGDCCSEKEIAKIKEMVDTALAEYEDDWNNPQGG
jgi:hypothetical protein